MRRDDTAFLFESRWRARHHLGRSLAYSHGEREYLALAVEDVVTLWLVGVAPLRRDTATWQWLISGDLPVDRLDVEPTCAHPQMALEYVRALRAWISGHDTTDRAVDISFVVAREPPWLDELERRASFLEKELVLPRWEPPRGACVGPTVELSAIEVVQIGVPEDCVDPRPALDIAARCHVLAALLAVEDGALRPTCGRSLSSSASGSRCVLRSGV